MAHGLGTATKGTSNLTQRIEKKLGNYNTSQNVLKRWMLEIGSWMVSASCMIVIVAVCFRTQDQPLSQWPYALLINNISSKIASAALLLPVSEAISQLKWIHPPDGSSKNGFEFEIIEKASRGAWGSLLLLFLSKGRSLAAMGAFLTLLMLATDTFFQQLTDLPEKWILDGVGSISKVVIWNSDIGTNYQEGKPIATQDINLKQVIFKHLYYKNLTSDSNNSMPKIEIPLSCPSSRCEWDAYKTLGVCSACANIEDLLTYACLETKLDWVSSVKFNSTTYPTGIACGYWLNGTSANPILMSGYQVTQDEEGNIPGEALLLRTLPLNAPFISVVPFSSNPPYGGSINYKDIYFPLLDALIVAAANSTAESVYKEQKPIAQECVLSFCVKTLRSTYSSGRYDEQVIHTISNTTGREQEYPWEVEPGILDGKMAISAIFRGNITIQAPATKEQPMPLTYGVGNETYTRTQLILRDIFPSFITVANEGAQQWWRVQLEAWGLNNLRPVYTNPWMSPDVSKHLESLATGITNAMRSHDSHEIVSGRAYTRITFIAVHWAWITFPITLLFLSLLFLIFTILRMSKCAGRQDSEQNMSNVANTIYGIPKQARPKILPDVWRRGSDTRLKKATIRRIPDQGCSTTGHFYTSPNVVSKPHGQKMPGWI